MRRVLDEDEGPGSAVDSDVGSLLPEPGPVSESPGPAAAHLQSRDGTITLALFPKSVRRACYLRWLLLQFDRSGFGNTFSIKVVQSVLCKNLRA